jgi:hypothetical protein
LLVPKTLTVVVAACALVPVLLVAGCGSNADSTAAGGGGSATAGSSAPRDRVVINVTIAGKKVTPHGDRVSAAVGRPVTLKVTADRDGELHVHSTPEQELAYKTGTTTLKVTIDKPGIVDIEDHIADVVVVQLEVR